MPTQAVSQMRCTHCASSSATPGADLGEQPLGLALAHALLGHHGVARIAGATCRAALCGWPLQLPLPRDARTRAEEGIGRSARGVLSKHVGSGGPVGIRIRVRRLLVLEDDDKTFHPAGLRFDVPCGRIEHHAGDPWDALDVGLDVIHCALVQAIRLEIQLEEVGAELEELGEERHGGPVELIVLEVDLLHIVLLHVVRDYLHELLQLLVAILETIKVETVLVLGLEVAFDALPHLELIRGDLQQRPHLPGLAHLDSFVEGHVLVPQGSQHAVRALEILQVQIGLRLRCVEHLQDVRDLLHEHGHRVPRLLRAVEELVDLQPLDELRLRFNEDGLCPAGLVKHILTLDVLQLGQKSSLLSLDLVELILGLRLLISELRVRGRGLA
mmetsp:Transcript_117885/g.251800  ORF Transcript_117885/g.251800 Transcript_117885/m.251800 type:complete len:385 (-) Transcript_117885:1511-2665(-)